MTRPINITNHPEDFSDWEWGECSVTDNLIDAVRVEAANVVMDQVKQDIFCYIPRQEKHELWFSISSNNEARFDLHSILQEYIDDCKMLRHKDDIATARNLANLLREAANAIDAVTN